MMKTELERLQGALTHQQRYLRSLDRISVRFIAGIGAVACVLLAVAFHLRNPDKLPLIALVLTCILGELIFVALNMGAVSLCRALARSQIATYQEAIEKLQREEQEPPSAATTG